MRDDQRDRHERREGHHGAEQPRLTNRSTPQRISSIAAWDVLSAVRGEGCGLEQFDEVAGGVGKQDLASAGAGHRVAPEGKSNGA